MEKRTFYIPVGNIPEDEIEDYIRKVAKKFKKGSDGVIKLKKEE